MAAILTPHPVPPPRRHRKRENAEPSQYVLYSYRANRPPRATDENVNGDATEVAEYLTKEATSNDDFSLSVVKTNISVEMEQDLRSSLAKRLARGCIYSGSGNLFAVDDRAAPPLSTSPSTSTLGSTGTATLCYYVLLRDEDESESNTDDTPSHASEFLLCLLRVFESADVELDLFRNEMDAFSEQLVASGHLRTVDNPDSLSAIDARLSTWFDVAVEYLPRCCDIFVDHLDVMLYATVVGRPIQVLAGSPRQKSDVSSFVHALSLSSLLDVPGVLHGDEGQRTLAPLQITFTDDAGAYTLLGSLDTVAFCRAWATAMANTHAAIALKQVIHAHELKIIQEINTMKRLVCQAAVSHYALYNTYKFVCSCETVPSVLLSSAFATASADDGADDTLEVMHVLLAFIRSRTNVSGLSPQACEQLREAMAGVLVRPG